MTNFMHGQLFPQATMGIYVISVDADYVIAGIKLRYRNVFFTDWAALILGSGGTVNSDTVAI